jgi:hypothetical protein
LAVIRPERAPRGSLAVVIVSDGPVALGGVLEQPADLPSHGLEDGIKALGPARRARAVLTDDRHQQI